MNKTVWMNFKIDKGLKEELKKCSKKTRQSMSRIIRESILKEIDRINKQ
jgi:predicted transcriptional regulator